MDANGKQIVRGDNGGLSVVGGTISGPEITGGKIRGASIRTMSSSNKFVMLESGMLSFCDGTYDAYNTYGEIKPGVILHPDFPDDFGQVAVISMDTDFVFAVNVSGNREFYVSEYRTRVLGDLEVEGSKARICDTENFGTRKLYAYETPTPYFGDIGSGVLNEDGICYVAVDDIFAETVNCDIEYQVFLQKEGPGDLWVDSKEAAYFVVKGTPNLPFSWEMKVLQKDYEYLRLEDEALGNETISYEDELMRIADAELAEYDKEMEDIGNVEESFESVSDY